jgi:isopropylmalate/homocitrate/citramalate synthase
MDTSVITEIAQYFEREINYRIPPNYPFIGRDFNVTRAGIHADGLLKDEEIYNIFDTARILDRPLGITVNDRSGLAGIAYWVNTTFGLKDGDQVRKDDPRIVAMHQEVQRQYAAGRTTGFSPDEMQKLARLHFGNALATSARS